MISKLSVLQKPDLNGKQVKSADKSPKVSKLRPRSKEQRSSAIATPNKTAKHSNYEGELFNHYAGPTFHHSPAPANLPPPPFLSRSMPAHKVNDFGGRASLPTEQSPLHFLFSKSRDETINELRSHPPPSLDFGIYPSERESGSESAQDGVFVLDNGTSTTPSRKPRRSAPDKSHGTIKQEVKSSKRSDPRRDGQPKTHPFAKKPNRLTTPSRPLNVVPRHILSKSTPNLLLDEDVQPAPVQSDQELRHRTANLMELLRMSSPPPASGSPSTQSRSINTEHGTLAIEHDLRRMLKLSA